jgi:tetratricopeptide (TPR) repeat protein
MLYKAARFAAGSQVDLSKIITRQYSLDNVEVLLATENYYGELDPNSAWAFTNKAWALNGLKRHDEALECSNKALALDPNSVPNWYMS